MKLDGLTNQLLDFRNGFTRRNTAGQIRDICRVIATRVFNDNGVSHGSYLYRKVRGRDLRALARRLDRVPCGSLQ